MAKLTQNVFIERCNKVHGNSYDYSKTQYIGIHSYVDIICPKHGLFAQIANVHLKGHGCLDCGIESRVTKQSSNNYDFINKANEVHNFSYDYSCVEYTNNHTDVKIICMEHGPFLQRPNCHLDGQGCPKCGRLKIIASQKLTLQDFTEAACSVHGTNYIYDNVEYVNYNTDVKIICPTHGEFYQTPHNHLSGSGCQKCGINSRAELHTLKIETFVERSDKQHNFKYDYSLVNYIDNRTKVIIKCPAHGAFEQQPDNHMAGHGCPSCAFFVSKPEIKWLDTIGIPNDPLHRWVIMKVGKRLIKTDGYEPDTNTIYEFYGDFWHGNPNVFNHEDINPICKITYGKLYDNTIEREAYLKLHGFNVISIWEKDFKEGSGNDTI